MARPLRYAEWLGSVERDGPGPAYLFCGPESLLRDQALDEIKTRLRGGEGEPPIDHDRYQGGEASPSKIASAFSTVGLFSSKRLVTLTSPEKCGRNSKKERDELVGRLREAVPGACFVAVTDLSSREFDRKNEFCRALSKACVVVEFWHPRPADAMRWILGECKRRRIHLDPAAGELLLSKIGPDLQELSRDLEKLTLWAESDEKIDAKRLRALMREGRIGSGWEFCDAVISGRSSDSLRLWDAIRGSEPVPRVLWLLQQRARQGLAQTSGSAIRSPLQALALRVYGLEKGIKSGAVPSKKEALALEGLIAAGAVGRAKKRPGPKGRSRGPGSAE